MSKSKTRPHPLLSPTRLPLDATAGMPDAARSSSLTPSTSYATFETPQRGYYATPEGHRLDGDRRWRSASQQLVPDTVSTMSELDASMRQQHHQQRRRRFSRASRRSQSHSRRPQRASGTFILAHPSASFEAFSAYSPRVSAVIPDDDDEEDGGGNIHDGDDEDDVDSDGEELPIPYGVQKMEILELRRRTVWAGVLVISLFVSLSATTTPTVEPFLVSLFGGHSYISSIAVMTNIAYATCKPPMAKILDVFGRAEGLALSAALYSLGYLLSAWSRDILTFGIARVIGSAGAQGINLAQQVIVADITSLASRGIFVSVIFLPWLVTPWVGPQIGQVFKDMGEPGYRVVFTIFGVLVPLSCLALLLHLWHSYRRTLRITRLSESAVTALKAQNPNVRVTNTLLWQPRSARDLAQEAASELDLMGILYLMAGCTLLLLPLSLAAARPKSWHDPLFPVVTLAGVAILCLLVYHEVNVAPHPLIPARLLKQKTVMAGCALGAFHFVSCLAYESYFPSFLQVSRNYSARDASYISESYVFSASIGALVCGALIKWTGRYKVWMVFGVLVHIVGAVMMVRFRSLSTTTAEIVMSQVIGGFGGGFTTLGVQLGVQAVVSHRDVAIVTAIFLTITQIGGAVGGAASGAIWTTYLPRKLAENLPNASPEEIPRIFGSMAVALSYESGTPERAGIDRAYFDVQRMLNLVALLGLLPTLLSALCMANVPLGQEDTKNGLVPMSDVIESSSEEGHDDDNSTFSFEDTPLRHAGRS